MFHRWVCPYCPSWFIGAFDNPLRRLVHDPFRLLSPYVRPGMTVLDIGCGAGYFSLDLARLVGDQGKVICLDLQERMLDKLRRLALAQGVDGRIEAERVGEDTLGRGAQADFALAFWMVHEVRDPLRFFAEVRVRVRPPGRMLVAEPKLHVTGRAFVKTLAAAAAAGWTAVERPQVALSRTVLLC